MFGCGMDEGLWICVWSVGCWHWLGQAGLFWLQQV
jgi:hypothetical protein